MTDQRRRRRPSGLKLIAMAALVSLAVAAFVTAEITGSNELWRLALNAQLQSEKRCRLDDMLHSRSFQLAGMTVVEGRIRCTDGREFTFTRPKPHLKFELRLCQPTVC